MVKGLFSLIVVKLVVVVDVYRLSFIGQNMSLEEMECSKRVTSRLMLCCVNQSKTLMIEVCYKKKGNKAKQFNESMKTQNESML